MRFLRSPVEIVAKDLRRVGALRLETMRLEDKDGKQVAIPNGSYEDIQVICCFYMLCILLLVL